MKLIETLRQRQLRIRRNIEAVRLRRIRRHTRPGYTHCMNCGTRLKGVWSLVRIQSPRLVKMKELSGWLSSFLFLYTDGLLTVGVENKCYQT